MPPEIARQLFDPYFTTKGEAGTGLGVPQVAAFMRSSGGTVRVNTEPGVGTSFDLLFPTADCRDPIEGNLWRQLDRWVNEGGRPDPAGRPAAVKATSKARRIKPAARFGFRRVSVVYRAA